MTRDSKEICSSLFSSVSGRSAKLKIAVESTALGTAGKAKTQSAVVKGSSHMGSPGNATCGIVAGGPMAGGAVAIIEALLAMLVGQWSLKAIILIADNEKCVVRLPFMSVKVSGGCQGVRKVSGLHHEVSSLVS